MMGLIRIIIGIICGSIILFMFNKYNIFNKRKRFIICFIISIVLIPTIMAFIPFENLFMTFDSPKKVYTYVNEKSDIKLIIEGNNTDLIIGDKNNIYTYLIVPKTEKGWKIGISINNKRIIDKIINENIIYIDHYKNTNDYYITVYNINGNKLNITDSCNSKFQSIENNEFMIYYAHTKDFDSNYWININNEKIKLLETK